MKFLCLKPAKRGTAALSVEYSKDLGLTDPWRTHQVAVPDSSLSRGGITFTIAETAPVSDYYEVTAEITEEAAPPECLRGRAQLPPLWRPWLRRPAAGRGRRVSRREFTVERGHLSIPTGWCPAARGCAERAAMGQVPYEFPTPPGMRVKLREM
ncbi:MAG: hypothetical protein NTW21_38380 [Verrucomicrobia bacterium]|nr:hypothetical protein [Verrucomicrobiota bacterium]